MATPNFEQIQSFNHVKKQLQEAAIDEFLSEMYDGITQEEVIAEAVRIAEKFAALGAELGAQWYDLCSDLAGINADPALVDEVDVDGLTEGAKATLNNAKPDTINDAFNYYLQNVINNSIRTTGNANLWRDYERGMAGGKWARVPVGETCAWCLMLASNGAWYLSKESALREEAGHYHDGCDCVAVYHADPESIDGYKDLEKYKEMYYDADDIRQANDNGKKEYPEKLAERIAIAKAQHEAAFENGDTDKPWTIYNEDLIVMRYKYGLK